MYWTLFLTFVKIGMFTIGGGYAMLPLIQRDVVDRGWMTKEDFIDVFSVAQSLPGIFAVNIAIFVGYKLKKTWGGFVCALGTILPSFVIMLLIALFFTQVKDNVWVEKAFMGLRPAGIGYFRVPSHNVDSDSSQRVQYRRVRPEETGFYQGFRKRA